MTVASTVLVAVASLDARVILSASVSIMLPVVPNVPTTLPPVPSALMPMPPLGKITSVVKSPIVVPEPEAVVSPIVMPVVGLPLASRPRVTAGLPRVMSFSGKFIASKRVAGKRFAAVYAGVFCVTSCTLRVESVGKYFSSVAASIRS